MKKRYIYLIIIIVSIISILPILIKSNVWGHDTNFHLANIEDISESITLSNPLPKISMQIGNGLGYGTHLFYAPLPHYLGGYLNLLFKTVHLGVDNCLVFIYLVISILSGITMYHLAYDITKNKYISLLSAIIFLMMPYRMGDIIIRSSLNEVFIFLFIPMILLSLNRLLHNQNFLLLFVMGYTGLILSHLVMALYTSLFLILWAIIHYKEIFTRQNIKKLVKAILLVSLLVLPFLTLVFSQKTGGNYLIFLENYMSNLDYMNAFSISIKDFLIPLKDYSWDVPYFINILVLISFIISIIAYIKQKKKDKFILYFIILTIISFIMCLDIFPWKILPNFLYMIQFPWRLETFITIGISIIAPLWLLTLNAKKIKIISIIASILLIISEIPFIKSMTTYQYLLEENLNYNYGMGHSKEYLPVATYENLDYFETRNIDIKCSHCTSNIEKNSSKQMIFTITATEEQSIELPRLYYEGYELTNSKQQKIKFYENNKGFIEFVGDSDTYTLTYKAPILYRIATIVSTTTILILLGYQGFYLKKKKPIQK